MRTYELVLVLKPSLSEKERTKLLDTIKGWFGPASTQGEQVGDFKIVKEEEWGQKPLAYKIKKEIAGYYHMLMIESEKGVPPAGFEKKLIEHENVLRHLLLRKK